MNQTPKSQPGRSQQKITALYERISREDALRDADSIGHQKAYLEQVAKELGFDNCRHYTDDGWSGGTFDRPGWKQMIADIEAGQVGVVLVKDMSRIGRDYLQTGFYTEVFFARHHVRFIAVDSHVDNQAGDSNEFAPLLNVMNEMYLHDQSRKVSIAFRVKGMSGKPLMVTPCFGYTLDSEDKGHWIVESEAAETVRRAFALAAEGINPHRIAAILRSEQRMTPGAYFARLGMGNRCAIMKADTGPCDWHRGTVVTLLQKQEYLGKTVNFKTSKASYKAKRIRTRNAEQMVFEHTHEPLVDQETWDRAQTMLAQNSRSRKAPIYSPFQHMVICARCGQPMYNIHYAQVLKTGTVCHHDDFVCSTHRNTGNRQERGCIRNMISARILRALLAASIQSISRYALEQEEDFLLRLQKELRLSQPDQLKDLNKRIAVRTKRISELDRLLRKLYEDFALSRIPESRFDALSAEYEQEQAVLQAALAEDQQKAGSIQTSRENADRFMALVKRYQDCTEYPDEVLRQFVEKVVVHETQKDADGERSREIEVYMSFIGKFSVPSTPVVMTPEEQKRQEALKKRRIHARNKRARLREERMSMTE